MATELKPCPHCGQTKTLEVVAAVDLLCDEDERDAYTHSDSFGVVCSAAKPDGPGGCGAMGGFMPTREAAAEAWNRRTQPAQVPTLTNAFLADVMTAAGLVTHGKQCKALGERLTAEVAMLREKMQGDKT